MTSYELTRCAVCGSAESSEVAGPDDIRREAELLWQFHMRRLSARTPPDRLVDRVAFSQELPWRVVQCRACGLVYRNPVERRELLHDTYAGDAPTRDVMSALHEAQRPAYRAQASRLTRVVGRRGSGLEVGSYVGAFLSAARESGWQFEGLDVNAQVNAFVRERSYTVHDGDLEHFRPERTFDAVAIWNTFDQVADPGSTTRAAFRLLRPDGVLAIRVPNGECYASWRSKLEGDNRVARSFALTVLAHNNLLTFPYRFGFSPRSLARLLQHHGFRVERVIKDALVKTADEWTRPWARIEERLIKPILKSFAPWFEMYARKASVARDTDHG